MKPKGFEISFWIKSSLYLSLALLFVTGVIWLILHYFFPIQTEFSIQPSPFESTMLKIHGFFVPIFIFVFGVIFSQHAQRAYKAKKNVYSGLLFILFLIFLILTGYILYYISNEQIRQFSNISHSFIGVLIVPLLIFHIVKGKKSY